jgi:hypothetical protein
MGASEHLTFLVVVRSEVDRQHRHYPDSHSHSCQVHDRDHLPCLDVSEPLAFSGYTTEKKSE